jgi:hypothetical protein
MVMFKIYLKTNNAAFTDDRDSELARILREVANQIEAGDSHGRCHDSNGNTVGEWTIR